MAASPTLEQLLEPLPAVRVSPLPHAGAWGGEPRGWSRSSSPEVCNAKTTRDADSGPRAPLGTCTKARTRPPPATPHTSDPGPGPGPHPPARLPASFWTRTASKRMARPRLGAEWRRPGGRAVRGWGAQREAAREAADLLQSDGGWWGGVRVRRVLPAVWGATEPRAHLRPGPRTRLCLLSARDGPDSPRFAPKPTNPGAWPPPSPRRLRPPRGAPPAAREAGWGRGGRGD